MNCAEVEERILGGTTTRRGDVVITRGEGCWLYDERRQAAISTWAPRRAWRCSATAILA